MANDSLGDMLTRIRNAAAVGHSSVAVRASKLNERVAEILKEEGYLDAYQVVEVDGKKMLNLTLRYSGERRSRKPVITGLQRVSRPGKRIYVPKTEIPRVLSGIGVAILSTPKGVITDNQARRLGVGGEVLCFVY
ncbi:MAG: 30S ribosomal protein S8 [Chloroflexi bacterium]|jgi:small subunit ribosomal protein S8|uniref:Small ribosomal subunit protein uS8 n=1 Tax=Candidatus Thermofonsia Clade 3 bacterium TaxID=2364212 RepID=A0A2M8QDB3_9CHLR|nr:30S ribosomal protein S8 [Candidatus Roseilinea sp. NK_OTU-006]PJF47742.1 MAG: 30S ribosomal protein S8 [Candidatus Thermofonsia Clade 3 bacterium]RMG61811.1 MAG: 30S ribosomal protein S8 [Chloroflexota bacterium]